MTREPEVEKCWLSVWSIPPCKNFENVLLVQIHPHKEAEIF